MKVNKTIKEYISENPNVPFHDNLVTYNKKYNRTLWELNAVEEWTRARLVEDIDITKIKSAVLARLVEEVRNNEPDTIRAFDRIHNRHNRS